MASRWYLVLGALGFLMSQASWGGSMVVAYYPSWNKASYPHTAILYENLTHIAHAFLVPNADGSLGGVNGFAYPELVQAAHARGVKVIVSLGGWGQSDGFSPMAANAAARQRFVDDLTSFCVTNGYDGADLDWEYPKSATDRTNMTLLVRDLRLAFNNVNPPLQLAMAGPASGWSGQWYDFAGMSADFDWIGIMTYDYYGSWTSVSGPNSALFGSFSTNTEGWVDNSVEYYNSTCAVPKEKLLIGVPFYGWSFRASSMYGPSTGAGQLPYSSIVPLIQQGWSRFWDAMGQVPYLINPAGTQVISYDDSLSVGAKCGYVKTKGLAGVIVWAIGQDRVNGNQPLLKTLGTELLVGVQPIAEAPIPTARFLFQNYPNPYNAVTRIRYAVAEHEKVEVNLYDALGRQVRTLVKGEFLPGEYEVTVSSDDLPSGCYIYRLTTQHFSTAKIMVVLR